jgi:ADP-heptose:LPS heptosyltransferase
MKERERNVLVILIAGIRDLIMASKAFRALRRGYPDRCLLLLTSTEASILAQNYIYLDHIWAFPVRQLRKSQIFMRDIFGVIQELRKLDFELTLNLCKVTSWRGDLRMRRLMSLLRAQRKAGHDCMGFGLFLDKIAARQRLETRESPFY